jgi:hypothetical protein
MATATKYRKDLTREDFEILRLFKLNMLLAIKHGSISNPITKATIGYHQEWYKASGWRPNRLIKHRDVTCYGLQMSEFRLIFRIVQGTLPRLTEGRMVDTLKRASLIILELDGSWKRYAGTNSPMIFLEYERLSPEGSLQKPDKSTPQARLDKIKGVLRKVVDDGYSEEEALSVAIEVGFLDDITADQVKKLEVEVEQINKEKADRRAKLRAALKRRS